MENEKCVFVLLRNEEIVQVFNELPREWEDAAGLVHNPRRLDRRGDKPELLASLGFAEVSCIVPEHDVNTHRASTERIVTVNNVSLVDGVPTHTREIIAVDNNSLAGILSNTRNTLVESGVSDGDILAAYDQAVVDILSL